MIAGIRDGGAQVADATREAGLVGAGNEFGEVPPFGVYIPPEFFSGGWNGKVIFDKDNGRTVNLGDVTGSPSPYLRVHISDALAGTVEYDDGVNLTNWPVGCKIYAIADISGALHVG